MERNMINEEESLNLIAQMINSSKKRVQYGSGNTYLVWGWITVIVSLLIWSLLKYTGAGYWNVLWFLIPIIGAPYTVYIARKAKNETKSYIDVAIDKSWMIIGILFWVSMVICWAFSSWDIMMPLALILCGVGVCMNGVVFNYSWFIYPPIISFAVGILMLFVMMRNPTAMYISQYVNWTLLFGGCFFVTMVIPGYILNMKGKKENV